MRLGLSELLRLRCGLHIEYILRILNVHQERSSAKRKELFRTVQVEKAADKIKTGTSKPDETIEQVKQLILDMPIRWSSTHGMLYRAVTLREVCFYLFLLLICFDDVNLFKAVDTFVSYMAREEPDRAKRAKLDALQLSNDEWQRVQLFLSLLGVSNARRTDHDI